MVSETEIVQDIHNLVDEEGPVDIHNLVDEVPKVESEVTVA